MSVTNCNKHPINMDNENSLVYKAAVDVYTSGALLLKFIGAIVTSAFSNLNGGIFQRWHVTFKKV